MVGGARNTAATAGYRMVARALGRSIGALDGVRTVYPRLLVEAAAIRAELGRLAA